MIQGERICLRPIEAGDTDRIVAWRNQERVRRNFIYQKPFTREGHEAWMRTKVATGEVVQFIICEKESGRPVGSVYFRDIDRENKKAEYGIFIGEADAAGKGIGTETARLAVAYARDGLKLHKLFLRVFADNLAAVKSYERAGFVREAYLRDEICQDGRFRDLLLMAVRFGEGETRPEPETPSEPGAAPKPGTPPEPEKRKTVSFVIPCYRSRDTIEGVVDEIRGAMGRLAEAYDYQVILVNDCSPDDTFEKIRRLCEADRRITGVNLAKNFGQHSALMAGFHQAKGDILVCLDDDGQTPADEVGKLLQALEEGADVAYARYEHKHHNAFRNFGSRINDWMLCFMLHKPKNLFVSSYFAARRFVLEEMLRYENAFPYVIGLVLRATKNIVNVTVEHRDRKSGVSGYTFGKLLALWFNGFTAFSEKPLRIATLTGVGCAGIGFLYGLYTVIKKLVVPDVPIGFSALMSAIMFIGGVMMLMLGLIGEYIGRMYICMNNAPQFVIREIVGGTDDGEERDR